VRICILTLTFAPDAPGGRGKYARELYDQLKSMGHEVEVITGLWREKLPDPNITQIPVPRRRFLWLPNWYRGVRKILKQKTYDIIHANGSRESIPLLWSDKPYITTIHDIGAFQLKKRILSRILKRNVKKALRITVPTKAVKRDLLELFPKMNPEKVNVIKNGINFKRYNPNISAKELRKELKLTEKIILYLGRIAEYKGVEEIIKAYNRVKKEIDDVHLVVAGAPTVNMKRTYNKWIEQHPGVLFTGYVDDDLVPNYYALADIFVSFSYAAEGFGLTVTEALACGKPVLCSDLPAYREVLEDKAILIPPGDITQLSDNMVKLLKDQNLRQRMGKEALEFVKQKYDWAVSAKKFLETYKEVLDGDDSKVKTVG
jgi:glycosyltransferase involved in cell wall biosynthesis